MFASSNESFTPASVLSAVVFVLSKLPKKPFIASTIPIKKLPTFVDFSFVFSKSLSTCCSLLGIMFTNAPSKNKDAKDITLPKISPGVFNTLEVILPNDLPKLEVFAFNFALLSFLSVTFLDILFLLSDIDFNCELNLVNDPLIFSAREFNSFALSSTAIILSLLNL